MEIQEDFYATIDKNWLKRRKRTVRIFALQNFLGAIEYSVFVLTAWIYINTLVDTKYPKIIYSLAMSSYIVASVISSIAVGKFIDKHRLVRKAILICNTLVIIGNILYSLHYSYLCLIFGRIIAGCSGPIESVISGEIARSYRENETTNIFSMMGLAFGVGFIAGPGINIVFDGLSIQLYTWKITSAKVTGVYMATLFTIQQFFVYFLVSDLSREFDLKSYAERLHTKNWDESNKKSDHILELQEDDKVECQNNRKITVATFTNNAFKYEENDDDAILIQTQCYTSDNTRNGSVNNIIRYGISNKSTPFAPRKTR